MEIVNCNLCGSEDYRGVFTKPDHFFFKDEWFTVVECTNCGLGFVNPRPTYEEMARYYPADYYEYPNQEHRYKIEARYVQELITDPGDKLLLDVGCANGDFPRLMKGLGWQVEAVEVSSNSKNVSDFKVYTQEFPEIPVHEGRYDVITAWAVLEHVHDPMAYFKKASEVLKPGGVFIFLVPNFASISSRHLFIEDPPRHLYYFTEQTVRRYLELTGLEFLKADYSDKVFPMSPVNWLPYYVHRYIKRRPFEWKDIPPSRTQYLTERGLENSLATNLRYMLANPLVVLDRAFLPIVQRYQVMLKKCGIVTYFALKK